VAAVVLAAETQRHARAPGGERGHWVLPVVVGLSVGIASLVGQRLLVIVVG
jgi:hypothetical protein